MDLPEVPVKKTKSFLPMLLCILVFLVCIFIFSAFPNESRQISRLVKFFTAGTSSSVSVTIANAAPEATGVSLNSGNTITLTENTTTNVVVAGTVTDNNSCKDLTSVGVAVYKDGTTCDSADDADSNNCYWLADSSPATNDSCTGDDDVTYVLPSATFTFPIQFFAENGTWKATVYPVDASAGTLGTSSGVTLNSLQSLSVDSSLGFGSVAPGVASTGDHALAVTNTGNVAIDFSVKGNEASLTCSTRGNIPVANEQYKLASFTYGDGTSLTVSDANVDAVLPKPTSTTPVTDDTYWQITIPTGVAGTCSGSILFTAISAL